MTCKKYKRENTINTGKKALFWLCNMSYFYDMASTVSDIWLRDTGPENCSDSILKWQVFHFLRSNSKIFCDCNFHSFIGFSFVLFFAFVFVFCFEKM